MTGSKDETRRRETVLGAVRKRIAAGAGGSGRQAAVEARLAGQAAHLIPARSRQDAGQLKALFAAQLRAANATVLEAANEGELPGVVAGYLRSQNLPLALKAGDDAWLGDIEWSREPALSIAHGRAEPDDGIGLTHAVAGIAETGTLMLASGPLNPVTLNFLPETSVVVVRAGDLVGPYEAAFDRIRARYGRGLMPRTLNLVSGPSRTADVGGRLVTGAHGPRRFCVIIVG
ncbi:MAG: lactate utilization protein [Hyphomicrobiaceae bacterium]